MKLSTAKLCVDCEEIHESDACPVCTSSQFVWLIAALGSLLCPIKERKATNAPRYEVKISPAP
jgi:RNA polymerase subunit RPABC4/transcription elongation factor Spt4